MVQNILWPQSLRRFLWMGSWEIGEININDLVLKSVVFEGLDLLVLKGLLTQLCV